MRRLLLLAALCAVAISVVAVVNAGGKTQLTTTLRFDEKATLFKVIDNPPADAGQNPETGDTVVFTGDLMSGSTKVGCNGTSAVRSAWSAVAPRCAGTSARS